MTISIYSDINKYNPTVATRLTNVDAVFSAVQNLFNTPPKQRLFRPEGYSLDSILFELDNDALVFSLKSHIHRVLANEPRLKLLHNLTEITMGQDNHVLTVKLRFQVEGLGDKVFERTGTFRRDTA